MKYKVVYLGNITQVAEYLFMSEDFDLQCVVTEKRAFTEEMKYFSLLRDKEVSSVENYSELENKFMKIPSDTMVLISGFGLIIRSAILERFKVFNIHFGELPNYKGRHPSFFATLNNEKQLGVSLHIVDEGIDSGKIISVAKVPYYYYENEKDIFRKLLNRVPCLISDFAKHLNGEKECIPNKGGEYFSLVTLEDKLIDENTPIRKILNVVRSQANYNGALIKWKGITYGIKQVRIFRKDHQFEAQYQGKLILKGELPFGIVIDEEWELIFNELIRIG